MPSNTTSRMLNFNDSMQHSKQDTKFSITKQRLLLPHYEVTGS